MGYARDLTMELHLDAIKPNDRVLIVDDILATGGTALGAIGLVRQTSASIVGFSVAVEIESLSGRSRVESLAVPTNAVVSVS